MPNIRSSGGLRRYKKFRLGQVGAKLQVVRSATQAEAQEWFNAIELSSMQRSEQPVILPMA